MDELEFRRRAIAHPLEHDPAFVDAAQASPANRKHLDEMEFETIASTCGSAAPVSAASAC